MTIGAPVTDEVARLANRIFERPRNGGGAPAPGRGLFRLKNWYRRTCLSDTYLLNAHVARAALETPAGSTLLDAGAGEQQYRWLFEHTRYVSCDFGKGDDAWNYRGLDVLCDLEAIPVASESVDTCLLTEVLEHLAQPEPVMVEIGRVLKPGGRVYVTVPFAYPEHQVPYDFHRYTSFGIRRLAEVAGLDPVEVRMRTGLGGFLAFYIDVTLEDRAPKALVGVCRLLTVPLKILLHATDREGGICIGFNCVLTKPLGRLPAEQP